MRRPTDTAVHSATTEPRTVRLEIVRGSARARLRDIAGPAFMIGTASDCDLVLGDPQFPEVHSYVLLTERGVWVRHLGGGPPIAVNGQIVQSAELKHGSALGMGPYAFRLQILERDGAASGEPAQNHATWTSVTADRTIVVPRATA